MGRVSFTIALIACFCLFSCRTRTTSAGSEPRQLPTGAVRESGPLLSYADVVDRVAPAVVTIRSSRRVRAPQQFPFFDDPFFRQFFGGGVPRGGGRTQVQQALGSGVIVQADGHILTNHHVVDGAEDIKVELSSSRSYSAKLVGSDAPSDLAVLKISAGDLPLLRLGDSDKVRVGDVCLAVGNPLGVGESVTAGIISAKGRSTEVGRGSFQDFLQTDAPINQGNSGGALVNTRGELIGINSQILSSNGGNIGIGFAIPSNMAKNVMNQLLGKGKVQRGMLGVGIQPVTGELASSLGLKEARGLAINSITSGGPAEKAGLKTGDVILQLNGKDVNDANELRNEIAANGPGTEVTLTILRDGSQQQVRARLGELTPESARAGDEQSGEPAGGSRLGVTVVPITPEILQQLGLRRGTEGVVVESADPDGPAAQAGIRSGDVIQEVNRQPVRSPADLRAALQRSGDRPPLLLINRGGQTAFVPVPLR
ncbi:MAG: DegQ family serine endoprotease [Acidobacteriia bacterium]|nr:DegQ family serine endoprotease [Terriglobia bacterium]